MTLSLDAPFCSSEQHLDLTQHLLSDRDEQTFSFVELVLYACEFSEDETEIADLVDAMFDSGAFHVRDLESDRIVVS